MQANGQRGDPDREHGHDHERQHQRAARETTPIRGFELPQLADGRGRRLGPRGERHRDGEGEQHSQRSGPCRARRWSAAVAGRGIEVAVDEHDDRRRDEHERHGGEDEPSAVPKPRQSGDEREQTESEHKAQWCERRDVCDQRTDGRGDRDRDRENEVDDESADRHEHPARAERSRCRLRRAPTERKARHQMPIVDINQRDHAEHEDLRCQQQPEVPAERTQRRFDRVRDRRNRVRHDRERESDKQGRSEAGAVSRARQGSGLRDAVHGRHVAPADQASRHTCPSRTESDGRTPQGYGHRSCGRRKNPTIALARS